jgi:hypothetical protein
MKLLIKLLVAALIVNAAYRCGTVAWRYYQFKDEVQKMVLFGQSNTVGELTSQILEEATKRSVPLDPDGLTIMREGGRTVADVNYSDTVEPFPRYRYPVKFSFSAEAFGLAGAPGPPRR